MSVAKIETVKKSRKDQGKCGEQYVGSWSGNIYTCSLKGPHVYHQGHCEGDEMEWPNSRDYCASPFPGTNDLCKRPPGHLGFCRVRRYGNTISFKGKR